MGLMSTCFVPLDDEQPELAERLRRRYAERWVVEAHLRSPRLEDAMDTIELKVAPDEEPGLRRLRLRSFYTGSTYWRYGWDGSEDAALDFMDEAAELQGANVDGDRATVRSCGTPCRAVGASAPKPRLLSVQARLNPPSRMWDFPKSVPTAKKAPANQTLSTSSTSWGSLVRAQYRPSRSSRKSC